MAQEKSISQSKRDTYLDGLKGVSLIHMTIIHLGLPRWAGIGTMGFLSAAEGFFSISGWIIGKVYVSRMADRAVTVRRSLVRRAIVLVGLNAVLSSLTMMMIYFSSPNSLPHFPRAILDWAFGPLVFWPPRVDGFLLIYAICFCAVAIVGPWIAKRPLTCFGISFGIWALSFILASPSSAGTPYFVVFSWQFLVIGAASLACSDLRINLRSIRLGLIVTACLVGFFVLRHFAKFSEILIGSAAQERLAWIEEMGGKSSLGPFRLFNFVLLALGFLMFRSWISPILIRLQMNMIGKVSLPVFVMQGCIAPFLTPLFLNVSRLQSIGIAVAAALWVWAFAWMWTMIKSRKTTVRL